jgi:hypothetical protein
MGLAGAACGHHHDYKQDYKQNDKQALSVR